MSEFHEGELAVQQLAGVRAEADRLSGMLAPPHLGGAARFLGERTFAALTGRDAEGRLWTSPLVGPPGFLDAEATTLRVHALPSPGDPLHDLPVGQAVGLIVMDYARRRRIRVNGVLVERGAEGLRVDVEQAFGNCPKYIRPRQLAADAPQADDGAATRGATLSAAQQELLARTETFFLGTTHPDRGVDTSHRGGPAGFIRVEDGALWWPDYPGNNMFTSFGNLAVDDTAAVLVPDFGTGTSLLLSGRAAVEWVTAGSAGDDGGTGRRVRFTVQQVAGGPLPVREEPTTPRGAAA
jgi:predicted pyridoxine 5'-phosphate oxidase superfamily flavin-nucleotide-binding protein